MSPRSHSTLTVRASRLLNTPAAKVVRFLPQQNKSVNFAKIRLQVSHADINTILAIVFPILFSAIVAYVVWAIQAKSTARRVAALESEKSRLQTVEQERQKLLDRLELLEKSTGQDAQNLALLKQEMLPMSEFMKRKFIDILTHPHDEFKVPDALLTLVKPVGAAMPKELVPILKEREVSTNPDVTEQEKLVAKAFPIMVRLAELEAKLSPELAVTTVQLVSSTVPTEETKKKEEG